MEIATHRYSSQNSSPRSLAMVLALATAVVLSPLYVRQKHYLRHYETKWSSGFVLPMILGGLIIAIRTTSSSGSSSSVQRGGARASSVLASPEASWVLRVAGSSWGLAGLLVMLLFVLSWQSSIQEFFWR